MRSSCPGPKRFSRLLDISCLRTDLGDNSEASPRIRSRKLTGWRRVSQRTRGEARHYSGASVHARFCRTPLPGSPRLAALRDPFPAGGLHLHSANAGPVIQAGGTYAPKTVRRVSVRPGALPRLFVGGFDGRRPIGDTNRLATQEAEMIVTSGTSKRLNRQTFALGAELERDIGAVIEEWHAIGVVRRLWRRDESVWTGEDENRWLGWLDAVDHELIRIDDYRSFAEEVRRGAFSDALLLGMGGSSPGPEMLADTFGPAPGFPSLRILDSTDPAQVRATEEAVGLARTLFIVSSKSGSTLEPNILKDHFFERVKSLSGPERVGDRFVAVTDPGSSMEGAAQAAGFRWAEDRRLH